MTIHTISDLHPQLVKPFGADRTYILLPAEEYEALLRQLHLINTVDWSVATTDELVLASTAAMADWFTPEEDAAWAHLPAMVAAKS